MYYGDKKEAMVNIMVELIAQGWKVYGFTEDKSDSMSDYYSPAHWDGIAAKNGYVLVVDQYSTSYSGYEVKKYDYSKMNKANNANEKVKKLTAKMLDDASTPNEKASCAILIEKESEKGNVKPSYTVLETYPTFAHPNPKSCSWHIEKNDQIVAKGTGIFACYVCNDHHEPEKSERIAKVSAMVKRFETAIKQDSALESEVIKVPVTVKIEVESDKKAITESDLNESLMFIMKVGYTHGNSKGTKYAYSQSDSLKNYNSFYKIGRSGKASKSSANRWSITTERFNELLTKGHIAIIELIDVIEYVEKVVYNKTAKKVKQDISVTALTGEVEEVVKFTEELELNAESILDCATALMTNSNDDIVRPVTAEEKEIFKNKLCEMIVDYKLFVNEEVIKYFKINGYKLMFELLESYTTQQAPEAPQHVEEVETTDTIIEEQKPMVNVWEAVKEHNTKIRNFDYNKQDILNHFDFLVNNKEQFYTDFMDFLNTSDKYKKKRKATKEEMTKQQYINELERLGYANADLYSSESYMIDFSRQTPQTEDEKIQRKIDNMKKVIDKITDESILLHIASKQAYRAELQKAVKEPETVTEYETKLSITGSLTEDEQVKYEALKALKQVEANELKKVKTIEAIENAEFLIKESKHTKTGDTIFIVNMKERVDKEKFNEINIKMKSLGAYYSSFPSNRGFIFSVDPTELLKSLQSGEDVEVKKERDTQAQADKLEQLADNMQDTIDNKKGGDRKTNTAKREREAVSAYADGEAMEFTQSILKNVSNALAEGSLLFLKGVNAKTHIETLESILRGLKYSNDRINNLGYEESRKRTLTESDILTLKYPRAMANKHHLEYVLRVTANKKGYIQDSNKIGKLVSKLSKEDYELDVTRYKEEVLSLAYGAMQTEKYSSEAIKECFNHINRLQVMGINTVEHLRAAMREYLTLRPTTNKEETKEQKIKKLESVARFHSNIDGYFPTPKTIVEQLLDLADITEGETVLEPSAGNGNILDGITEYLSDNSITASVEGIEYNNSLRNILELKNYKIVAEDFLQYSKFNHYNKVLMNPPFEKNADIDHVLHAFKMLKNNGRIVAIMSPHFTFANDSKSVSFREWLSSVGYYEKLPEGSFKESGTGVNTVIVVIDKMEQQAQQAI